MPPSLQQALDRAIELHSEGKLDAAEQQYRQVLESDAGQADALHYLGVIALQRGQFEHAVEQINRAIAIRPDYVDAIVNLGYGLNALGQFDEAAQQFEHALTIGPTTAPVLANLGSALDQLERHDEAIQRFQEALQQQPGLVDTRRSLADTLLKTGRAEDAWREIRQAAAGDPSSVAIQISRGNILLSLGRAEEAAEGFRSLLDAQPQLTPLHSKLGDALRATGKTRDAIHHYETALKHEADNPELHYKLGVAYQDLGQKDDALAAFRGALDIDKHFASAWHGIAAVSKKPFTDAEVNALLVLQSTESTSPNDKMRLAFALGKHLEDADRHTEAAEQYRLANAPMRASYNYDVQQDLRSMRRIAAIFDEQFFARHSAAGLPDDKPIFIVGMPRSGTTLVEQILASHADVYGAGELSLLVNAIVERFPIDADGDYSNALANASDVDFAPIAARYLNGLPNTDASRVTDKLPHNFLNIGMIRILFRNATIVHCARDPLDTCFSIYKNLFGVGSHFYAYELEELAHYYNGYRELMAHWESVLPGVIHTVNYESLIDDQEQVTRELLAACRLDWDPICLDFFNYRRSIATISATQVQQPVYRSSIGAWQPYADLLAPVSRILN